MRASTARLMNSPVRLADLTFPQVTRLIHRTRLAFVHLDNLLAFGKRDRDGRIDGFITAYLPEECLLLFFRKGEAVSAASLDTTGRRVITITEALKRMRAEVERGELAYSAAPMEQLAWMYQSCAAPVEMRTVDPGQPGAFFAAFARDKTSGILELTSNARVSYVRFDGGRYASGYFCDKPEVMAIPKFLESQFHASAERQTPVLTAAEFPYVADLPQQAPNALINTYRELYWRIVDEVDKEFPGEAKRRAQKVSAGIVDAHKAIAILSAPRGTDTPDSVVQPEELSNALTDWSPQLRPVRKRVRKFLRLHHGVRGIRPARCREDRDRLVGVHDARAHFLSPALRLARKFLVHLVHDTPVQLAVGIDERVGGLLRQIGDVGEHGRRVHGRLPAGAGMELRLEKFWNSHLVRFVAEVAAGVASSVEPHV